MGNKIGSLVLSTLVWIAITSVIMATVRYFTNADSWLVDTLNFMIPAAVGYIIGYSQSIINERMDI